MESEKWQQEQYSTVEGWNLCWVQHELCHLHSDVDTVDAGNVDSDIVVPDIVVHD